jgi:hypothetical protein
MGTTSPPDFSGRNKRESRKALREKIRVDLDVEEAFREAQREQLIEDFGDED